MGDEKATSDASSQTDNSASIGDKTRQLLQSATSAIVHGRGRRPANCPCPDCVAKRANPSLVKSAEKAGVVTNAPVDAAFVAETVSSALAVLTELARDTARATLEEIVDKDKAEKTSQKVGMSTETRLAISNLSGVVAKQYGVAGQHTPAVMLGTLVVVTLGKNIMAFREIKQIVNDAKNAKVNNESKTG